MRWLRRPESSSRRLARSAERLAGESEAFLSGRLGVLFERHGMPRPVWTWINTLAHAEPERILALAKLGCEADRPPAARTEWDHAAALLALEITQAIGDDARAIRTFQREHLVPLETEWIAGVGAPKSPRELVQRVMAVLPERRSERETQDGGPAGGRTRSGTRRHRPPTAGG